MWALTPLSPCFWRPSPENAPGDRESFLSGTSPWSSWPSLEPPSSLLSCQVPSFWLGNRSSSLSSPQGPEGVNSTRSLPRVFSTMTSGNRSLCFLTLVSSQRLNFTPKGLGHPSPPPSLRTGHVRGLLPLCGPNPKDLPGQNGG